MVKTSASNDGSTDSNLVAGAPFQSSGYATDDNIQQQQGFTQTQS